MARSRDLGLLADLPEIPEKLYFSISDAGKLVAVKPCVLRFWEEEFGSLLGSKRRNGRRYYERKDILKLRHIRHLLYTEGLTIEGARQRLTSESDSSIRGTVTDLKGTKLVEEVIKKLKEILVCHCGNQLQRA